MVKKILILIINKIIQNQKMNRNRKRNLNSLIKIHNIYGDEFIKKYGFKCPLGVRGRNSDNRLFKKELGWEVSMPLIDGMTKTYNWINKMVEKSKKTSVTTI